MNGTSPLLLSALLLAGCGTTTIKFPDTGVLDDTGTPDTDTADTDIDTGDTDTEPLPDPFTGENPVVEAGILLLAEGSGDGVGYAGSLAASPDLTGDGNADLLVGARSASLGGTGYEGRAYLVSRPPPGTSDLSAAHQLFNGEVPYSQFGTAVTTAGDVDGDGAADVAIGAPGIDGGSVYVFRGPFTGGELTASDADTILAGESDFAYTGISLGSAGDVNNDGSDDLVVGSYESADDCPSCGSVFISLATSYAGTTLVSDDAVRIYGDRARGTIGYTVTDGADFDGDGAVDIMVGAPNSAAGGVALFYGPFRSGSFELSDSDAWFAGGANGGYAGQDVLGADLDGDGYDDLAIGSPYDNTGGQVAGKVYLQRGSGTRWGGELALADGEALVGAAGDYLGSSVNSAGDVDGDGTVDMLVGAPYASGIATYGGAAYLVYGSEASGSLDLADVTRFSGVSQYGSVGYASGGAGDIDGDGRADVAVSALIAETPSRGGVYVFLGE